MTLSTRAEEEKIRKKLRKERLKEERKDVNFDKRKPKKQKKQKKSKNKQPLTFPWWCKIVAYALSYAFSGICVFFILSKGISFGNDKCTAWLTSIIISLFSSVFLTQPIQVYK